MVCWGIEIEIYTQATLKETYNKSEKIACHQVNKLKKPLLSLLLYFVIRAFYRLLYCKQTPRSKCGVFKNKKAINFYCLIFAYRRFYRIGQRADIFAAVLP